MFLLFFFKASISPPPSYDASHRAVGTLSCYSWFKASYWPAVKTNTRQNRITCGVSITSRFPPNSPRLSGKRRPPRPNETNLTTPFTHTQLKTSTVLRNGLSQSGPTPNRYNCSRCSRTVNEMSMRKTKRCNSHSCANASSARNDVGGTSWQTMPSIVDRKTTKREEHEREKANGGKRKNITSCISARGKLDARLDQL